MTKPVRTVVIGCGAVFENAHRDVLFSLQKRGLLVVIGLVEPNVERLRRAGGAFPAACCCAKATDLYSQISDVELTLIASPPPLHMEQALTAFEFGSHVFSEKPIADSVSSAEAMIGAANEARLALGVGMPRRFYPCYAAARSIMTKGEIGSGVRFVYREGGVYRWPVATIAPFFRKTSGGGVLLDKGIHALDVLYSIFGGGSVEGCVDDGVEHGVESNAFLKLRLARATGDVLLSWDSDLNSGLWAVGSSGELWMPIGPLNVLWMRRAHCKDWERIPMTSTWPTGVEINCEEKAPTSYLECFTYQLIQMLRAVRLGEAPGLCGSDAVVALQWISKAYSQSMPMTKPWLSDDENQLCLLSHWRTGAPCAENE